MKPRTVAEHLLLLLGAHGVEHLFLNPGTDSAPIQEAALTLGGEGERIPRIVPSTFEAVTLAAAHGYFLLTGRPQCVFVHVDAGTQNLGAMLHDAYRGQAGVVVLAGHAPYAEGKTDPGGRSSPIHWQQDVADQAGIVRGYTKLALEVVQPNVLSRALGRALRVAAARPSGPCYLTIARDVLMAAPDLGSERFERFAVPAAPALDDRSLARLAGELARSERAVLVTARAGRSREGFAALARLGELGGIWLAEGKESHSLNIATDHPWLLRSGAAFGTALSSADLVLVVDCDVPWVPRHGEPSPSARIVQIDTDPTKPGMPLWTFPVDLSFQASGDVALRQLLELVEEGNDPALVAACERRRSGREASPWVGREAGEPGSAGDPRSTGEATSATSATSASGGGKSPAGGEARGHGLSPVELMEGLNKVLEPDDIVIEEAVTNSGAVREHLTRTMPATQLGADAAGLGWSLGAALGVKLAAPDRRVVVLCGDGSFLFASPTSALTMAAEQGAAYLLVVLDNGGYRASRLPVYELFPDGSSAQAGDAVATRFAKPPDLSLLARACHAHGERVERHEELAGALRRGLDAVAGGQVALVDVLLHQD